MKNSCIPAKSVYRIFQPTLKLSLILFYFSGWALGQIERPIGAPITLLETELGWQEWPQKRSAETLLELEVVRDLLSIFVEHVGQTIIIRYPGGDQGNNWALEFREWLVSLGLPFSYINLQPGSGGIDRLFILVEMLPDRIDTGK